MTLTPPPATVASDVGWCWWTRPRATDIDGTLYTGGVSATGEVVVATFERSTGVSARHVLATIEGDDHNNPAVVAVPDRPLLAFYARHSCDRVLRYRISAAPLDAAEWLPERQLTFGGVTTYAQVHVRDLEVHVFTRVGETGWSYRRSADWAESWDPERPFIVLDTDQQAYMPTALLADRRTVRVAISGHPKDYEDKPVHDIWACLVDLATGDVTLPSTGTVIANVATGVGLPLAQGRLELVLSTPLDRTVNVFDVSIGDEFEIAYSSKQRSDESTIDARYHVSRLGAGGWVSEDVAPAGAIFGYIPAGFYVGGMAFPAGGDSGRVYVSREDNGLWHLEEYSRSTAGWMGRPLVEPGGERTVRPWAVSGSTSPDDSVLALVLEHYDHDYCGTRSRLVTIPAPRR